MTYSPLSATTLTGRFCSCAMKPTMEKMTNPAKKLVVLLRQEIITASLWIVTIL